MYILDGIVYAGEQSPELLVCGVRPLDGHRLWVRFNNGEEKVFDFTPLLKTPAFAPLADDAVFRGVYIDRLRKVKCQPPQSGSFWCFPACRPHLATASFRPPHQKSLKNFSL